jgi:hypothetical protein
MENQAFQNSILYETRKYGTWLANRALCESCNSLSSYLGLVDTPISSAACSYSWKSDFHVKPTSEQEKRNQSPNSYQTAIDPFSTNDHSLEQLNSAAGKHRDKTEEPPTTVSPSSASSTSRYAGSRPKRPNRSECDLCHKRFPNVGNRNRHIKVVHRGQDKHPCAKCGKILKTTWYLERHQRNHCSRR